MCAGIPRILELYTFHRIPSLENLTFHRIMWWSRQGKPETLGLGASLGNGSLLPSG
jgi:hypothetical protein